MSLTPEEQRFFETGELQPGMDTAAAPAPAAPLNPVDLAGLGTAAATAPAPAPAPVAAPTPAPAPAVDADPDQTESLRRALAQAQQQVAELSGFIQGAVRAQPQPQPEPPPDPATDPIGSMMHQLDNLNKQVLYLQQGLVNSQQQTAQMTQLQAFAQQVQQLKQQFVSSTPDFDAAVSHLRNARIADLRAFGASDQVIARQLAQEELAIAEAAISNGRNPAQVIYEMSKRHGYNPTAAPASAPGAAPAPSAAAQLEAVQRAQAAGRSLAATPDAPVDPTIANLRQASDADLNKVVMDPKLWNQISGQDSYPL